MSLRIRCPSCRRSMSGRHSLCSDCRASSSTQRTVYVAESGERVEVVTTGRPSRSASFRHVEPRSNHSSAASYRDAGRNSERHERDIDRDIANGYSYVDAYGRDARQRHETVGATYVRPRVHPYSDRYEYVSAEPQSGYPLHGGVYTGSAQQHDTSSWHSGYSQYHSEGYYHQPPQAHSQQAPGQASQVEYVYSGTEGPDGEIID